MTVAFATMWKSRVRPAIRSHAVGIPRPNRNPLPRYRNPALEPQSAISLAESRARTAIRYLAGGIPRSNRNPLPEWENSGAILPVLYLKCGPQTRFKRPVVRSAILMALLFK